MASITLGILMLISIPATGAASATVSDSKSASESANFKCYYCATPKSRVAENAEVKKKLEGMFMPGGLRRVPAKNILENCDSPKNLSTIPTTTCQYETCLKWIFGEKKRRKYVIRGCAENVLGGMSEKNLNDSHVNKCLITEGEWHTESCTCTTSLCNGGGMFEALFSLTLFCLAFVFRWNV